MSEAAQDMTTESSEPVEPQVAAEPAPSVEPQSEPANWRDQLSGGDADLRKALDRFTKPEDVTRSFVEARQKLSERSKPLTIGEDSTDEDVAAYREAMGIPAEAKGYEDALKEIVIGDEDRPIVEGFLEVAHKNNATPQVVNAAVDWYYKTIEAQGAEVAEFDKSNEAARDDALRAAWGNEFRLNQNAIENYLESLPAMPDGTSFAEVLKTARLGNNVKFTDSPEAQEWLLGIVKAANPAMGVMPAGTSDAKSIDTRIGEIKEIMRTDRKRYNRDAAMQKEYQDLIAAKQAMTKA